MILNRKVIKERIAEIDAVVKDLPLATRLLYGLDEIAQYLRVSVSTVKQWKLKQAFPISKMGKRNFTTTGLIDIWLMGRIKKQLKEKLRLKRIEEKLDGRICQEGA